MARAVLGDVIEGLLQVIDNPDRKNQIGVLGARQSSATAALETPKA